MGLLSALQLAQSTGLVSGLQEVARSVLQMMAGMVPWKMKQV